MFTEMFPILSTRDLEASLHFYRDLLDGTVEYQFPDDGPAVYLGMVIGCSHFGLGADPEAATNSATQSFSLWVYADDCDAAAARLAASGAPILEAPTDQPWGERVARVQDPDGNIIIIGSRAIGSRAPADG